MVPVPLAEWADLRGLQLRELNYHHKFCYTSTHRLNRLHSVLTKTLSIFQYTPQIKREFIFYCGCQSMKRLSFVLTLIGYSIVFSCSFIFMPTMTNCSVQELPNHSQFRLILLFSCSLIPSSVSFRSHSFLSYFFPFQVTLLYFIVCLLYVKIRNYMVYGRMTVSN